MWRRTRSTAGDERSRLSSFTYGKNSHIYEFIQPKVSLSLSLLEDFKWLIITHLLSTKNASIWWASQPNLDLSLYIFHRHHHQLKTGRSTYFANLNQRNWCSFQGQLADFGKETSITHLFPSITETYKYSREWVRENLNQALKTGFEVLEV